MKLIIILLAVASLSRCDKLDRTYLPPAYAQTSGGSGNFLQTPNFSSRPSNGNGFASTGNDYAQNGNGFAQTRNEYAQNENGFAQAGNDYAQNGKGFSQGGNDYSQDNNGFAQGGNDLTRTGNDFAQNGNGFAQNGADVQRPERPRAALERTASILRQDSQNDGETYSYSFETENGISAEENGVATNGVEAQGGFSYTGDDGQVYTIRYTADQNGFVPQGAHLPTAPPVPEEILKALEQNARDEANGIFDDGSYQEGKYADSDAVNGNGNYNTNANQNYNGGNQNYDNGNQDYNNGNQNYNDGNQNYNDENLNYNDGNLNYNNGNQNTFARDEDTVITNSAVAGNAYLPPLAIPTPVARPQAPIVGIQRQQNGIQRQPTGIQRQQTGIQRQQTGIQRQQTGIQRQQTGIQRANAANPTNSYLPPLNNQVAAVRNQIPQGGIQRETVATSNAYLPPLDNQRAAGRRPNNQRNFATPPQNSFGPNGVTNSYLPPIDQARRPAGINGAAASERSPINGFDAPVSRGFGQRNTQRRPNYNARDGYQY